MDTLECASHVFLENLNIAKDLVDVSGRYVGKSVLGGGENGFVLCAEDFSHLFGTRDVVRLSSCVVRFQRANFGFSLLEGICVLVKLFRVGFDLIRNSLLLLQGFSPVGVCNL